ncbi:heavy-metal-associated domain-containing protein [Sphingomonas sp. BIUV-7]|uniref:Heavy-metal-associated domain-containing protein n=1 Tax=Sphingomonas natans TaxID=3063330 RepID=A0ABT8YAH9_9SPHN|nr:heavy-metal-associated domain-containing protein [Sphingomonas sp. BIUV-7]MDO6414660.1 heavy-metal-associated domain-containing protein [Sphingomonas sp. BIUV-7]
MTIVRRNPLLAGFLAAMFVVAFGLATLLRAQIEGNDRGVPPIDSSANYEVGGVQVDVTAKTSEQARSFGWRLAQRKAWKLLWGRANGQPAESAPGLPDGTLDAITAGISVEDEEIGAHRYIARLGVLFDRGRAGDLLGARGGGPRSAPMLVIPVMWSGGVAQSFEKKTEWQKAWARFRSGGSPIDYVRPVGTGIDPLVLNIAQAGRPGRGQWRTLLEQYGAADVVVPTVQIVRRWPGGPVLAHFKAIHGPDGEVIARFDLAAADSRGLPAMLDEGVRRIDEALSAALRAGGLISDPSLLAEPAPIEALPEDQGIVEGDVAPTEAATSLAPAQTLSLQVDTPDDAARAAIEAQLRGVLGVRSVTTTSLALGGVSVVRVEYEGDAAALRAALAPRGLALDEGLRLRRSVP